MKNETVRARVNGDLKHDVEHILSDLGLTVSDAINALFSQIKLQEGLPFDVKVPNKMTIQTLKDSADGKNIKRFDNIDDLFNNLDN